MRFLTLALLCGASAAYGANATDGVQTFQSGDWSVYRGQNALTDSTTCTGIYKTSKVQLSSDALYIQFSEGLRVIKLRYGDQSVEDARPPTTREEELRAIVLEGGNFTYLLTVPRLRGQVLTRLRHLEDFEIDLAGFNQAVAHIKNGCPDGAPASVSAPTSTGAKSDSPATKCEPAVIDRMISAGLTRSQIQAVCFPKQ